MVFRDTKGEWLSPCPLCGSLVTVSKLLRDKAEGVYSCQNGHNFYATVDSTGSSYMFQYVGSEDKRDVKYYN